MPITHEALAFLRVPSVDAAAQALEQRVAAKALQPAHPRQHAEAPGEGEVFRLVGPGGVADFVRRYVLPAEPDRQRRRRQRRQQAAAAADMGVHGEPCRGTEVGRPIPVEPDDRRMLRQRLGQLGQGNHTRVEAGLSAQPGIGGCVLFRNGVVRLDEEDGTELSHVKQEPTFLTRFFEAALRRSTVPRVGTERSGTDRATRRRRSSVQSW